ncbi:formate dehydrogenase subunit gamma [Polynucleobacter sphagniphilus]|uniref:formate dehydrogenase subunit gamma n=1 Tax=Polynucleobacter sphagniphilus TaxID=1743169 RepID=UPI002475B1FF|nr:formate dehydrogenase subunit gamma [Polynucleobacter sphagniphilus]MDH6301823.1 formate dehydrogenase subunit gamma [Polynucleobacter sphagniphilus]
MTQSFFRVVRPLILALGLTLTLASGFSFAERAPMAPLPSPSGVDVPPNPNSLANGTQAQSQPANSPPASGPIWETANSDPLNYVSIPDTQAGVLIQRSGQQWRLIRNGIVTVYGAWLLAISVFGIAALYLLKGPIKLHEPLSGVMIKRFSRFERFAHWTMAYSFVALAFTGLMILYGKYFAMPVIGGLAYGKFLFVCKNIHNFTGPLFTLSIIVFFCLFVRKNLLDKVDIEWLMAFGGILSGKHVPSGFFNLGEKIWFWCGMVILGLTISASGWVLDMIVPFIHIEYWRGTMQLANLVHAIGALLMTAMAMGHIYIGTIGMQGSIDGMKTGYVDETWAKEHHEIWYNEIK